MVVRQEQVPGVAVLPEEFRLAVDSMKAASFRPEVTCEEMRAPQRIAPYSFALSAGVTRGETDEATGRLTLLHDPDGNETWQGTYRCVAYVRADIDPEQIEDGMLSAVAWTWLTHALRDHDARHLADSGTVMIVTSESFGSMADEDPTAQVEIRASWTPILDESHPMSSHVEAWGELLCSAVGIAPVPEGVTPIPSHRGHRDR